MTEGQARGGLYMEKADTQSPSEAPAKGKASGSRLYFKQTDLEMIRWLTEFHYLQPHHFRILAGDRNIRSIRRRLLQLYRLGYFKRQVLPIERERPLNYPPDQFVYYLAPRGIALAQEYGFADDDWNFNDEKSPILLPHDLAITDFHLCLAMAVRSTSNMSIVFWEQRRSQLLDFVEERGERLSINPDGFFGIKNSDYPENENTSCYFLEIVRARESDYRRRPSTADRTGESYLLRKMRAYNAYFTSGKFQAAWGMANFRVITVLPSEMRVKNFCGKLIKEGLSSQRFLISYFGAYSLEAPGKILESIFWTPKGYDPSYDALSAPTCCLIN